MSSQNKTMTAWESTSSGNAEIALRVCLIVLAAVTALVVLVGTSQYGIGINADSINYVRAAREVLAGEGFLGYNGAPMVNWPPLYPLLLAALSFVLDSEPVMVARGVGALTLSATVIAATLFARRLALRPTFVVLGAFAIAIAPPLVGVAVMALSEALFVLLSLLFLVSLVHYAQTPNFGWLAIVTLLAALGWMTRYIGVTLLLTGLLVIAARFRSRQRRRGAWHLLFFTALTTLPIALWLGRNYVHTGTFLGQRAPSRYSLVDNLTITYTELVSWLLPADDPSLLIVASLLVFLLVALLVLNGVQRRKVTRLNLVAVRPVLIYIALYLTVLVLTSTTTSYDRINDRLLSPVYVPLVLVLLVLLEMLVERYVHFYRPDAVHAVAIVLIGLLLLAPLRVTLLETKLRYNEATGEFSSQWWRESATMAYVDENLSDLKQPLFSNAPDALYYLGSIEARMLPAKRPGHSAPFFSTLDALQASWPAEEEATLILLHNKYRDYLYTIAELGRVYSVTPLVAFDDGALYTLRRPSGEGTNEG